MENLYSALDGILSVLWNLLCRVSSIFLRCLVFTTRLRSTIWERLASVPFLKKPWERLNEILARIDSLWGSPGVENALDRGLDAAARAADFISSSALARRWLFGSALVLWFFAAYPPSYWGPWYRYQSGTASCYGPGFYYKPMANTKIYLHGRYSAAHRTLPLGTSVLVRNQENGKTVLVSVTDRGPFVAERIIDLSMAAAAKIDCHEKGVVEVDLYTRRKH